VGLQNGLTLSGPINRMGLLTLPDLFRRKYGGLMEVIVTLIESVSFTFLLAGNLVGTSMLVQFVFNFPRWAGVVIAGTLFAIYTIAGGLFTIAYVDIPQVRPLSTGCVVITMTSSDLGCVSPGKAWRKARMEHDDAHCFV